MPDTKMVQKSYFLEKNSWVFELYISFRNIGIIKYTRKQNKTIDFSCKNLQILKKCSVSGITLASKKLGENEENWVYKISNRFFLLQGVGYDKIARKNSSK